MSRVIRFPSTISGQQGAKPACIERLADHEGDTLTTGARNIAELWQRLLEDSRFSQAAPPTKQAKLAAENVAWGRVRAKRATPGHMRALGHRTAFVLPA